MISTLGAGDWRMAMTAEYERLVREAGLVNRVDGAEYVAAMWTDPVGGDAYAFAEYADPCLLIPPALRHLECALRSRFPAAEKLIVRAPAGVRPAEPWRRYLTYVRAP